jgi:MYXO-CTERM domain-containing protein
VVRQCVAFGNRAQGFYANHHPGGLDFFNNIAFRNGTNYNMLTDTTSDHKLRNNIAMTPGTAITELTGGTETFNSWTLQVTVSSADFVSVTEAEALAPRAADGSLPAMNFLRLAMGSDLIDKGENVGLPFAGAAPDLGPFESGLMAGTGGMGGSAGSGGRGGRAAGGTAGTGMGGALAGAGGTGTAGASGGSMAMGGTSAGSSAGGTTTGGAAGDASGGTAPSGGSSAGGTSTGGVATGGLGGNGGATGGTPPAAGTESGGGDDSASDDASGCGCRVGSSGATETTAWLSMIGVVAFAFRRRRRRSTRGAPR